MKDYLVCDNCGERSCWDGVLMCWSAKSAGICTRAEWEDLRLGRDRQQAQGEPLPRSPSNPNPGAASQREGGES